MVPGALTDDLGETATELNWENVVDRLLVESPEMARAWSGVERAKCALARNRPGELPISM